MFLTMWKRFIAWISKKFNKSRGSDSDPFNYPLF